MKGKLILFSYCLFLVYQHFTSSVWYFGRSSLLENKIWHMTPILLVFRLFPLWVLESKVIIIFFFIRESVCLCVFAFPFLPHFLATYFFLPLFHFLPPSSPPMIRNHLILMFTAFLTPEGHAHSQPLWNKGKLTILFLFILHATCDTITVIGLYICICIYIYLHVFIYILHATCDTRTVIGLYMCICIYIYFEWI